MNHKVRKNDRASSSISTTTEALTVREIVFNHRKEKGDVGKSKTNYCELRKNQCAFYKKGYWKIDFPRLKKKKGPKSEANIAQANDGADSDSSMFSLYYPFSFLLVSVLVDF